MVLLLAGFVSCSNPNNGDSGGNSGGGNGGGGSEKTLVAKYSLPNVSNGEISIRFYSDKSVEKYSKLDGVESIDLKGTYKLTGDWDNGTVDVSWDYGHFTDDEPFTITSGVLKNRSGWEYNKVDNNGTQQEGSGDNTTGGNNNESGDNGNNGETTGGDNNESGNTSQKPAGAAFSLTRSNGRIDTFKFNSDNTFESYKGNELNYSGTYTLTGDWENGSGRVDYNRNGSALHWDFTVTNSILTIDGEDYKKVQS